MPFLHQLVAVWLELAPWLLLGAAVAGLLHAVLPPDFVERWMRGRAGVVRAVLIGVPLPLCSCGVIPAGLSLKRQGASDGASVGFLISTPQTGVDSVLVSASFLGWPFALFKVGAAALLGLVGGWVTERAEAKVVSPPSGPAEPTAVLEKRTLGDGVAHTVMLLRMIWRWLVFGAVVSALLTTFLPADAFAGLSSQGVVIALFVVLLVSLPLYVCATASVPIAAALVASGFPPGAALVFLMAGPATNVATIGAVYRSFGKRVLAIYLATIIVGSVGLALVFDSLFTMTAVVDASQHVHGHNPIAWLAGGALLAAIAYFAFDDLRQWLKDRRPAPAETATIELSVEGMTCQGCVRRLQGNLEAADGVVDVKVSLDEKLAKIAGNVSRERMVQVVTESGFRVV